MKESRNRLLTRAAQNCLFLLFLAELLTPPNFRESSRAATVKEWLPISQSLFGSGHAGLASGPRQANFSKLMNA
jgi:hypothetical protein